MGAVAAIFLCICMCLKNGRGARVGVFNTSYINTVTQGYPGNKPALFITVFIDLNDLFYTVELIDVFKQMDFFYCYTFISGMYARLFFSVFTHRATTTLQLRLRDVCLGSSTSPIYPNASQHSELLSTTSLPRLQSKINFQ